LLVLAPARSAHAEREPSADDSETARESHWYGWQTLLVDGGAIGLAVPTHGIAFLVGYPLGGPTVHIAHGHAEKGSLDLLVRVGTPVGGALVGALVLYAIAPNHCSSCDVVQDAWQLGAVYGALLGGVGAMAIDAAVLAREEVPVAHRATDLGRAGVTVTPTVRPAPGSITAGVLGTF
jgi:hypothetical protein